MHPFSCCKTPCYTNSKLVSPEKHGLQFLKGSSYVRTAAAAVVTLCLLLSDSACGKDHQPACLHLGFLHLYGGDGFKRVRRSLLLFCCCCREASGLRRQLLLASPLPHPPNVCAVFCTCRGNLAWRPCTSEGVLLDQAFPSQRGCFSCAPVKPFQAA